MDKGDTGMTFDKKRQHGIVCGMPGVAYEQDGKLFNINGEPVDVVEVEEETLENVLVAIPKVLERDVVAVSDVGPVPFPYVAPVTPQEAPKPPTKPATRPQKARTWRKKPS